MKNKICLAIMMALSYVGLSQVGVGNTNPNASLDVTGIPADNTVADGIIAPRLTGNQLAAKDAIYGPNQTGAQVYVTAAVSTLTTKTANVTAAGYYYFDGAIWQAFTAGNLPDGDAWGVTGEDIASNIGRTGNVGIGTITPRAGLELSKTPTIGVTVRPLSEAVNVANSSNYNLMLSNSDNATIGAVSGFSTEAGGFNTYLQARGFAANGPAYNLLFNPVGGNVGVGTAIPTQRLTIDGNITTVQDGQRILFPHSNAVDGNDGTIGSAAFEEGLNIVGTQTVAGNGRRITTIGDVVHQNRVGIGNVAPTSFLDVNGDARVRNIPAGLAADIVVTADANGNIRQRTAAQIVAAGGGNDADGDAWGVTGEDIASNIGRTGNVGIGIAVPTQKLQVDGNQTFTSDGNFLRFPNTNQTDGNDGIISAGLFEEGLNIVGVQTVAGNGRRITTFGDVVHQNRVGIGNVPPTSFLDVNGDARVRNIPAGAATDIVVTADANGNIRQRTAAQIVAAGGGNDADGDAWGVTGEDIVSNIGRTGNVGIGTIAPRAGLELSKTPAIGATVRPLSEAVSVANSGNYNYVLSNSDNATVGAVSGFSTEAGGFNTYLQARGLAANAPAYNLLFNPVGGNVGIGTAIPTQRLTIDGNITTVQDGQRILFPHSNATDGNDGTIGSAAFAEGLNIVGTQTVAGNGRRITTIGDVVHQNRVGIGNVAPTSFLDVNGNARVRNIPAGVATDIVVTADANGNIRQRTAAQIVAAGGGNLYTSDGTIAAATNRNITLADRITSKINIAPAGESANISTLNVIGGLSNGGSTSGITVSSNFLNNTLKRGILRVPAYVNTNPTVQVFSSDNDFNSNLLSIGGINSNSQSSPTQINFTVDGDMDLTNSANASSLIAMTIKGVSGNVGIGTNNPRAGLEVSAGNVINVTAPPPLTTTVTAGSTEYNSIFSNGENGTIGLLTGFVDQGFADFSTYLQARSFVSAEAFDILLNPLGGFVGIGTLNPTQALSVNGNIVASGTITPDYVFESYFDGKSSLKPTYKMMSLEEVEAFIKSNKHLPGVFSASEVKENGGILINRATEQNLEKVEELYLHTIEQNKKIKQLSEENKKIEQLSIENKLLKRRLDALEKLIHDKLK